MNRMVKRETVVKRKGDVLSGRECEEEDQR